MLPCHLALQKGSGMEITGGCLCKAVRYKATAAPVAARACWCRVCQYIGAGSGTVNAIFKRDTMTITGEMKQLDLIADSGNHMHRSFCPKCGTHLFNQADERPNFIVVRVGTLDDPEIGKPSTTIWTDAAPSWACINPDLPKFPAQPPG
jgi:hypothetical protein